jgi:gliding motility-associated lipoprotein GldH
MVSIFSRLSLYLSALFFLAGCTQMAEFEKNYPIDPEGWSINDSVEFSVPVSDTLTPMNFVLSVRHNTDYEYSNIYFFLNTRYPNSDYARDTIQLLLAGRDGKWYGSGLGKLREVEVMLKSDVVFPMSGTYRFSFVQAMRVESLKGVEDIGIRIEKSGSRSE